MAINGNKKKETYQWRIAQNKPIRQLRRLSRKPHTQHTSPIMRNNNRPLRPSSPSSRIINPISRPDANDKISQILEHIGRRVFIQLVSSTVAWQVNDHHGSGVLEGLRFHNITPDGPAIRETVDENEQRFCGG